MPRAKSGLPGWELIPADYKNTRSRKKKRESMENDLFAWFSRGLKLSDPPLPRGWWCSERGAEAAQCLGPFPSLEAAQLTAELSL